MRLGIFNWPAPLLRTRLFVAVVSMVLLSGSAVSGFTIVAEIQAGQKQAVEKLEAVATLKHSQIGSWIKDLHTNLTMLFTEPSMIEFVATVANEPPHTLAFRKAYAHLQEDFQHMLLNRTQLFDEVFLVNPQGRIVLSTAAAREGMLQSDQSYFREGSKQDYLEPPVDSAAPNQKSILAAHPIQDAQGNLVAVIAGRVRPAMLNAIMLERAGLGETGETYLVDTAQTMLTVSRFSTPVPQPAASIRVNTPGANAARTQRTQIVGFETNYRGTQVVGVYHWLPDLQAVLVAEQAQAEAFASVYSTLTMNIGVTSIILLVAALVALQIIRGITKPLAEITQTAAQITNGNLDLVVHVERQDEIGTVARAFNNMTSRLRELIKQLQAQVAELEQTQRERERAEAETRHLASFPQKNPNLVIEISHAGQITYLNPAAQNFLASYALAHDAVKHFLPAEFLAEPARQHAESDALTYREITIQGRAFGATIHHVHEANTWRIYANDITKRKQAESALLASEERYRSLFNNMTEGFALHEILCDEQGKPNDYRFLDLNPSFERLTGLKRENVVGKIKSAVLPDDDPYWVEVYGKVALTGEPIHLEHYAPPLGRWYAVFAYRPAPRQFAVIFEDVTERRKTQEALRQSQERFRVAQELSLDAFTILAAVRDDAGKVVDFRWEYVNPEAGRLLQHAPEELVGQQLLQVLPGNQQNSDLFERYVRVVDTGEPHDYELCYQAEGIQGWFRNMTVKLGDGIAVYFTDITERKKSEQTLLHRTQELEKANRFLEDARLEALNQKNRLEAVMETLPVGIAILDTQGGNVRSNQRFEQTWGMARPLARSVDDYAAYKAWWVETGKPVAPDEWASARAIQKGETVIGQTMQIERFDGARTFVLNSSAPVLDAQGNIAGAVVAIMDVTDRIKTEAQLRRLNRTLQAYSRSNQALMRATNEMDYLQEVCRIIVEDCGHAMVWIGYAENDEAKTVRPVAYAGFEAGYLETLQVTWADTERGRGPTGTAIRTGQVAACRNMLTDPRFLPWREQALQRGYASSIVFPILANSQALGAVTIYSREVDPFSPDEVKLLTELTNDLTYGIQVLRLRAAHAQAEHALRESAQRYRSLFNGMTEGFVLLQVLYDEMDHPSNYRFLEINPAFERLTGLAHENVVGKTAREVLINDDMRWIFPVSQATLAGESFRLEYFAATLNQHFQVFAYSPAPYQIAVMFLNITERKRMESELVRARDELELRVRERTAELENAVERLNAEIATRKQVEEQIRQTAIRRERLTQVASRLNAQLGLDTVLYAVCEETARALNVPVACLSLYNEKQDQLEMAAILGLPPEFRECIRPVSRASYDQDTPPSHPIAIIPNLQTSSGQSDADAYARFNLRTAINIRLESEGQLVGALNAFTIGEPREFTDNDLALLRGLARQAVQAIINARLYKTELQARQIAETLTAANLALTASLDIDVVLETLLDYLVRLVPYDSAHIMLLEAESRLTVRASRGYKAWPNSEQTRQITFDTQANPVLREIFATRTSVLIPDTEASPEWEQPVGAERVRSWLGVPLVASNRVIGLYSLDKATPGFFTPEHQHLAEALAAQAAIAVQNAWLFEQVRAGREGLQSLSRRLVQVQENERGYIARELHDEAGQLLTGLKVGLRVLEREAHSPQAVSAHVAELRQVVDNVMENLHHLAVHLRPATLDQLGLVAALREYVEGLNDKRIIAVEFEARGFNGERLPSAIETALYRIVQEALTNIVRHAHASWVQVLLERFPDHIKATVDDNGVGFDFKQATQSGRLGLIGMQERVEMLNGKFILESSAGEGTTLIVEVPYADSHSHRG